MEEVILAACTLVQREDGLFLALYSDERMNSIPGGKLDTGESDMQAAIRETFEETGYEVEVCESILPFKEPSIKRRGVLAGRQINTSTFLATASGLKERLHTHEGDVKWTTEHELCNHSAYSSYNTNMFKYFRENGVQF